MHEVAIVDPCVYRGWNEALLRTPGATFFHSAEWAEVLRESYRYTPFYLTVRDQKPVEVLLAMMEVKSPLTGIRGVSLPFTDYCEPIVSNGTQFREVFTAAVSMGKERRWRYLELRGGETFLDYTEPSEWHYAHTVDLGKIGRRRDGSYSHSFSDSNRRNIRKAEKHNLDITISTSPDVLRHFCRLNVLTRKSHGLPPQPDHFFQCVHDHILSQNRGFIVVALLRGTAIAANVYFTFGDQVVFKYGASDRAFQHLRASNLVMWKAICWGCDYGYRTLCLGRTEPYNEGLRRFKAGWSAHERVIRYYRYDLQNDSFIKTPQIIKPLHKKIFGSLPIPILKLLGRALYRHIG